MGLRNRVLTDSHSSPSSSDPDVELTPLAQRFYASLLSLGTGEGVPSQVQMLLPMLVKTLQRQGLTDDQIRDMLGFARAFIDSIGNEPEPPLAVVVEIDAENEGVETVAESVV